MPREVLLLLNAPTALAPPYPRARPVPPPATRLTGFTSHLGELERTNNYLFARYYCPSRAVAPFPNTLLGTLGLGLVSFLAIKCHNCVRFRANFAFINSRVRTNPDEK